MTDYTSTLLESLPKNTVTNLTCDWLGESFKKYTFGMPTCDLKNQITEYVSFSQNKQKRMYGELLRKLTAKTKQELDFHSDALDIVWRQICNDVIACIIMRSILLKKQIETIDLDDEEREAFMENWREYQIERKEKKQHIAIYKLFHKDDMSSTDFAISHLDEENAHLLLKDLRSVAKKEELIIEKLDLTDCDGNNFYTFKVGNKINNVRYIRLFEMIFNESEIKQGRILFFKSQNKRNAAYEWIIKNTIYDL